ncbi:hypothetical protein D3C71_1286030 [compost metagenome]
MVECVFEHLLEALKGTEIDNPVTGIQLVSFKFQMNLQRVAVNETAMGVSAPLSECARQTNIVAIGFSGNVHKISPVKIDRQRRVLLSQNIAGSDK